MSDDFAAPRPPPADLGRVLSELVHDLANELQILHGWSLVAQGEVAAGRAATSEIDRIVGLSSEMGGMLRDVVEATSGASLSPEATFDPRRRAEALLNDRVREFVALEVEFVSLVPEGTEVRGRSSFWSRALGNLVGNAARHARGLLRVVLTQEPSADGPRIVARVEDDGPGVAPGDQERLFRPGWRGAGGNTGLGLGAARWLSAQLGGDVSYVGRSGLGGAAFELSVPAATRLVAASKRADAGPELGGSRLLVVDDNDLVRAALARLLGRLGAAVRELDPAGEPESRFVERVVASVPDAIVLDLHLGGRGGVALWRRLRAEVPELAGRTLFVSGAGPDDPAWREAAATGQPLLPKPFAVDRLLGALRELATRR